MISLNEQLLKSIENIDIAIADSELDVCMEMVSGYSKIQTLMEYASDDFDYSSYDIFTEAEQPVQQPAQQNNQQPQQTEEEKKKKYKGISGFFKRIGHAIKTLIQMLVSHFRSTTRIISDLLMDKTYRKGYIFNIKHRKKYKDMSMDGIPPLEPINKEFNPAAINNNEEQVENNKQQTPVNNNQPQQIKQLPDKQSSAQYQIQPYQPQQQQQQEQKPKTYLFQLADPVTIYSFIVYFSTLLSELLKNPTNDTVKNNIKKTNQMVHDMRTNKPISGTGQEMLIKLNVLIEENTLNDFNKKFLQLSNYDLEDLSLYNISFATSNVLKRLNTAVSQFYNAESSLDEETKKIIFDNVLILQKVSSHNIGIIDKIVSIAQSEKPQTEAA